MVIKSVGFRLPLPVPAEAAGSAATTHAAEIRKLIESAGSRTQTRELSPSAVESLVYPGPFGSADALGGVDSVSAKGPLKQLGTRELTVDDIYGYFDGQMPEVSLSDSAVNRMKMFRDGAFAALDSGERVYGWNQALGPLKDRQLTAADQAAFQRNTLVSNAAAVGPLFEDDVARLALLLRANMAAHGHFAVRPELAERMLELFNAGIIPQMPMVSLGTGDLQAMAPLGLALIGEKVPVKFRGQTMLAPEALKQAGLKESFPLEAGESLPIISGSTAVAAGFMKALHRARKLQLLAEGTFSLFVEATRAERNNIDPRTAAARGIPSQVATVDRIRRITDGSEWMTEAGRARMGEDHARVQDAVSIRDTPHLHAMLADAIAQGEKVMDAELNASTSNPLLFRKTTPDGKTLENEYEFVMGGNWDSSRMGQAIDGLNMALAKIGMLSEARSARLLGEKTSYGLPPNLTGGEPGANSGMIQTQTTATSVVPEMQVLASPATLLDRPAKNMQEDYSPMSMTGLKNLNQNLDNLETILGVETLMNAQGIDLAKRKMGDLPMGRGTEMIHRFIRQHIDMLGDDRYLSPDLQKMIDLIRSGQLHDVVKQAAENAPAAERAVS